MDEYISREATIDAIKKIYCPQCNNYNGAMCRACEHMDDMDIIEDMPAADVQPVNQWISVDDELPEWDKTVLVWYASDTLFGVSEGYGLSWYHGSWRLNDLNGENIRIFYWRYLPEKPKGGR
jgi:hypothetical protein